MEHKRFSSEFKAKGPGGDQGEKTVAQRSSWYGVHASQINSWKKLAQERLDLPDARSPRDELRQELRQDIRQEMRQEQIQDWRSGPPGGETGGVYGGSQGY